jgi:hypothetical protein
VSPDRLQRTVCSLADGSLTITLTRHSETEIRALVRNGDNGEYGVTLAQGMTSCSCKDALYRGVVCTHSVAVALHVLRTPQPKEQPVKTKHTIHLMWRDGRVGAHTHLILKGQTHGDPDTTADEHHTWGKQAGSPDGKENEHPA